MYVINNPEGNNLCFYYYRRIHQKMKEGNKNQRIRLEHCLTNDPKIFDFSWHDSDQTKSDELILSGKGLTVNLCGIAFLCMMPWIDCWVFCYFSDFISSCHAICSPVLLYFIILFSPRSVYIYIYIYMYICIYILYYIYMLYRNI